MRLDASERFRHGEMDFSQRIGWLDGLRGFAMLCVIMGHLSGMDQQAKIWLYSFHMPLFCIISGALFRYEKYDSILACVKDQAKKLLFPYVMLTIVCAPFWYINHIVFGDGKVSFKRLLVGFLTADQYEGTMTNGALWFLPALFLTSVVFWFLVDLDHKGKVNWGGALGICAALAIGVGIFCEGKPTAWNVTGVPAMVIFYGIGCMAMQSYRRHRDAIESLSPTVMTTVIIALMSVGTWAAFANTKVSLLVNDYEVFALMLVSSLCISACLALLFMNLPNVRPLTFAGRYSLDYLGLHIPMMRFFESWRHTAELAQSHAFILGLVVFMMLIPVVYVIERFTPILVGRWPKKKRNGLQ